jgi:hypothetical protein
MVNLLPDDFTTGEEDSGVEQGSERRYRTVPAMSTGMLIIQPTLLPPSLNE